MAPSAAPAPAMRWISSINKIVERSRCLLYTSHFIQNTSDRLPLAGVAMALLALASAVSLLVVLAICSFIEIQQFYRLLGERGYLMLALPVPIWQHIAAKVICGTVWTLFGMVFLAC